MTIEEVLRELQRLGSESTKKTYLRHGAPEPIYGVRVGDLKPLRKALKGENALALELYATGNSDAMYLAGLVIDPLQMSKVQLRTWAKQATWYMVSEFTVAGAAAESPFGYELALEWIKAKKESVAAAGWTTLANWLSITPDEQIPVSEVRSLLEAIPKSLAKSANRVRYAMNGFVIAAGSYVAALTSSAVEVANKIGKVEVDMGDTQCKTPLATEYLAKMQATGRIGQKRKQARCL